MDRQSAQFVKGYIPPKMLSIITWRSVMPNLRNIEISTYICLALTDLESDAIVKQVAKRANLWHCIVCGYFNKIRVRTLMHIEAMHVGSIGYRCGSCNKFCSSKNALSIHVSRYHREDKRRF